MIYCCHHNNSCFRLPQIDRWAGCIPLSESTYSQKTYSAIDVISPWTSYRNQLSFPPLLSDCVLACCCMNLLSLSTETNMNNKLFSVTQAEYWKMWKALRSIYLPECVAVVSRARLHLPLYTKQRVLFINGWVQGWMSLDFSPRPSDAVGYSCTVASRLISLYSFLRIMHDVLMYNFFR
jgi:hypothetical protein